MLLPLQIIDQDDIAQADSLFRAGLVSRVHDLSVLSWGDRLRLIAGDLWHIGLKIIIAAAIIVVGRWIISRLVRAIERVLGKWNVDPALRTFIRSMLKTLLYFVLFYCVIVWLGVNTSLFVALFAAAGIAIGMAMSGVFQNIAGGVVILILKPFKCGDWVEIDSQAGVVMDIRLFDTILRTADNRTVRLPNGSVATGVSSNHTSARTRRLEWVVSLALGSDFDAVRAVLVEMFTSDERIHTIPPPEVVITRITNNSIDLSIRAWVATPLYWEVFWHFNAAIYRTLPARGFDLGSPQTLDVTLLPPGTPPVMPPSGTTPPGSPPGAV